MEICSLVIIFDEFSTRVSWRKKRVVHEQHRHEANGLYQERCNDSAHIGKIIPQAPPSVWIRFQTVTNCTTRLRHICKYLAVLPSVPTRQWPLDPSAELTTSTFGVKSDPKLAPQGASCIPLPSPCPLPLGFAILPYRIISMSACAPTSAPSPSPCRRPPKRKLRVHIPRPVVRRQ